MNVDACTQEPAFRPYDSRPWLRRFDENRELDLDKAASARRCASSTAAATALIINGTTGESPTVFYPQKIKLFSAVVEAVGDRVPVIANVGDNCTADTVDFARDVAKNSASTASCAWCPTTTSLPQEGMYRHFAHHRQRGGAAHHPVQHPRAAAW